MYSFNKYSHFIDLDPAHFRSLFFMIRDCDYKFYSQKGSYIQEDDLIKQMKRVDHDPFLFKTSFIEFKD